MFKVQNPLRTDSLAWLLLGLISLTGCHQLSKNTRSEQVIEREVTPQSPSLGREAPQLEPVPQQYPNVPLLPPPAPPTDSARRGRIPSDDVEELGWEGEDLAANDRELGEFFPEDVNVSREFLTARALASADRLAEAGRLASQRRADQLPIIVPGRPTLRRVSAEEPKLMPVPR